MIRGVFIVRNILRNMVIKLIVSASFFPICVSFFIFPIKMVSGMWAYRLAAADYQDLIDQGMGNDELFPFRLHN